QYGHIYIVESAGRVRKILLSAGANPNLSGSYTVYAFAGANTPGFTDGIGTAAHFSFPSGVAVDPSGNVYVADKGNERIRFIGAGAEVVTIAGNGTPADTDGTGDVATLNEPSGIVYYNGALFICEASGNCIREMLPNPGALLANPSSWNVTTIAGIGIGVPEDGRGDVAGFNAPQGIAVDKSGGLLVLSQNENTVR